MKLIPQRYQVLSFKEKKKKVYYFLFPCSRYPLSTKLLGFQSFLPIRKLIDSCFHKYLSSGSEHRNLRIRRFNRQSRETIFQLRVIDPVIEGFLHYPIDGERREKRRGKTSRRFVIAAMPRNRVRNLSATEWNDTLPGIHSHARRMNANSLIASLPRIIARA